MKARAVQILGECVPSMIDPDFPSRYRVAAFKSVILLFFKLFPTDINTTLKHDALHFDASTYIIPAKMHSQILCLKGFMNFFRSPEYNDDQELINYTEKLFALLLSPSTHTQLQLCIVRGLSKNLPFTTKNRSRIEECYKPLIYKLRKAVLASLQIVEKYEPRINITKEGNESKLSLNEDTTQKSTLSLKAIKSSQLNLQTSSDPLPSMEPSKTPIMHQQLLVEISKLYSVWFPRVSDEALINISPTNITKLPDEGYMRKRWNWLFGGNVEEESFKYDFSKQVQAVMKSGERFRSNKFNAKSDELMLEIDLERFMPGYIIPSTKFIYHCKKLLFYDNHCNHCFRY